VGALDIMHKNPKERSENQEDLGFNGHSLHKQKQKEGVGFGGSSSNGVNEGANVIWAEGTGGGS